MLKIIIKVTCVSLSFLSHVQQEALNNVSGLKIEESVPPVQNLETGSETGKKEKRGSFRLFGTSCQ